MRWIFHVDSTFNSPNRKSLHNGFGADANNNVCEEHDYKCCVDEESSVGRVEVENQQQCDNATHTAPPHHQLDFERNLVFFEKVKKEAETKYIDSTSYKDKNKHQKNEKWVPVGSTNGAGTE